MEKNGINMNFIKKNIYAVIMFISVLWLLLTSISYLMPATEFFFKNLYNNQNKGGDVETVYVNSPPIVRLLDLYVIAFDIKNVDIKKLESVEQIERKGNYWLIWDKKYDEKYDYIREKLGFAYSTGYRTEPSFKVSNRAHVLDNFQPVVSFIRYGELEILKPLEEFAVVKNHVIKNNDDLTTEIVANFNGNISRLDRLEIYFPTKSEYKVNVKGIYVDDEIFDISELFNLKRGGKVSLPIQNVHLLSALKISITSTLESANYKIKIGQLSYPDVTYDSRVLINGRISNNLTDDRLSSTHIFDPAIENEILIYDENYGKDSVDYAPISSYSFSSIAYRNFDGSDTFSWSLYGSDDELEWQLIDKRRSQKVAVSPDYVTYLVKNPGRFMYYKFIFDAQKIKFGLSEIQLTPIRGSE